MAHIGVAASVSVGTLTANCKSNNQSPKLHVIRYFFFFFFFGERCHLLLKEAWNIHYFKRIFNYCISFIRIIEARFFYIYILAVSFVI